MKRPIALCILMIAAGLGRPAWGQDYLDGLIPAPYASELSASRFRTRNPYAPNGPANSHGDKLYPYSDTSPSEDETALNPYATEVTGAPTANDRYGASNGRGTAYPNIPSFASNPYARLIQPYANRSGGIPSAPGARGTYDQTGNYDDRLATYPGRCCASVDRGPQQN